MALPEKRSICKAREVYKKQEKGWIGKEMKKLSDELKAYLDKHVACSSIPGRDVQI